MMLPLLLVPSLRKAVKLRVLTRTLSDSLLPPPPPSAIELLPFSTSPFAPSNPRQP